MADEELEAPGAQGVGHQVETEHGDEQAPGRRLEGLTRFGEIEIPEHHAQTDGGHDEDRGELELHEVAFAAAWAFPASGLRGRNNQKPRMLFSRVSHSTMPYSSGGSGRVTSVPNMRSQMTKVLP